MGGAPLAAIKMGEQDHDGAEKIMSNAPLYASYPFNFINDELTNL